MGWPIDWGVGCVLRAYGVEFDVDRYLAEVDVQDVLIAVWHKGKRSLFRPASSFRDSGFHLQVSEAAFSDVQQQLEDASAFLRRYEGALAPLRDFPGVAEIVMDFPVEDRDVGQQVDFFPPGLLRQMGVLGIGLMVSRYPRLDPDHLDTASRD